MKNHIIYHVALIGLLLMVAIVYYAPEINKHTTPAKASPEVAVSKPTTSVPTPSSVVEPTAEPVPVESIINSPINFQTTANSQLSPAFRYVKSTRFLVGF